MGKARWTRGSTQIPSPKVKRYCCASRRPLVRARTAASEDLRRKRQQLLSFLLRHGRIYSGRKHWTKMHLHWLAQQKFDHPAQQIVFQETFSSRCLRDFAPGIGIMKAPACEPWAIGQAIEFPDSWPTLIER
jgi:hypothetical protein